MFLLGAGELFFFIYFCFKVIIAIVFPWEFMKNIFIKISLTFIGITVIILSSCFKDSQIKTESPDFKNAAILVQHMQNDVAKEGGYMDYTPLNYIQSTIPNIKKIIVAARDQEIPVIYSYLSVKNDYSDALFPFLNTLILQKRGFLLKTPGEHRSLMN